MMLRISCESAAKCQQIAAEMETLVPALVLFTVSVVVLAKMLSLMDYYRLWPWVK